ncbi:MAG: BlaI/MecI/CopY family transcriptional regulator [Planctomycetota bacterium]|nr:BlaI/MecI/CopY family transcriptional regulator [Planctomycetota bacterium]
MSFVPTERELELLKILWEIGPASVRDIHARVSESEELAFNTVQTLLRIMDDKGLVGHKTRGRTFIYYPKYDRQRVSSHFLDKVFDGALDQLVLSMLGATDSSPQELRDLEKLIAEARRKKESKRS